MVDALLEEDVNIIASAQDASECNVSCAVAEEHEGSARHYPLEIATAYAELQIASPKTPAAKLSQSPRSSQYIFKHRIKACPTAPLFSVIIGVYNDWVPLGDCLQSLARQANGPSFEVIIVDDGSKESAPESVHRWSNSYPLTIVRQSHAGISAARNRGARISKGSVLLFLDADCRIQANCLEALGSTIADSPRHNCFQLHLVGDCSGPVGRAEELRFITLQDHMLQPDGCIRYLNTAGFAIRRTRVDIERGVFDPTAIRSEDTLLLAKLIQSGELPLFAVRAVVQHTTPLSLMQCFTKDIRSAFLEKKIYSRIASNGVRIQASHRERLSMLSSMWKASRQKSIGRLAWFVLAARQVLRLMMHLISGVCGYCSTSVPLPAGKSKIHSSVC